MYWILFVSYEPFLLAFIITFYFPIGAPIISNIRNNTSELTYSGYYLNSQLFGNEGDHILLSFTVKAKPPVSTSDIRFLIYSEPLPNITVTGSSVKLSFNNLGRSNAGRYIIKVGNAVGYQILVFKVVVYCKLIGNTVPLVQ